MGTKIVISYLLTFLLILVGKSGGDLMTDEVSSNNEISSEWLVSASENSDSFSYACQNLNSFSANSNASGSIKFARNVHSRHTCRSSRTVTIFNRISTHQISDLMGTSRFLIALEKLMI